MQARPRPAPDLDPAFAAIDAEVARRRSDGSVPGLTIAVTDRDGLLLDRVYGHAEVASARPVAPTTLFEIGSIGKTFTAIVVMQLAAEGRLSLDDPVVRHLPWFRVPRTGPRITIRHLLSHTAGITAGVDGTPEAAFQVWRLRNLWPGSGPGRRYHYSNVGYKALGLVVEALDGEPYPAIIRRRILEPLGMHGTEPEITNEVRARMAVGYAPARDDRVWSEGMPLLPATWIETATADGCLVSTAADMAMFIRMLLRGGETEGRRVIAAAALKEMATPVRARNADGYGLGLITHEVDGHRYVGHTGGMVGSIAGMWSDLEVGLGAVVLQTGFGHSPFALTRLAIRSIAAAREGRDLLVGVPAPPTGDPDDAHTAFVGRYVGPRGRSFRTRTVPAGLALDHAGHTLELIDYGTGRYLVPGPAWDTALLSFNADGDVAWHGADRYVRSGRRPALPVEPSPGMSAIAGHYRSHDPWTTNFRVVIRGDVPWLCFPAAPDGFEDEQPLRPIARGGYRVGDDPLGPERLRFDTPIDGHTRRAWLSGWDYYRVGDP
jgi:CubicO group peptidase (beta-lactamase class C family)